MTRSRFVSVLVLLAASLLGCEDEGSPPAPFEEPGRREKLLQDLAVFATGEPMADEELATTARSLDGGTLTIDGFIDKLIARPMGPQLAKDLVISPSEPRKDRHPIPVHSVLRHFTEDGRNVYYLKDRCKKSEAVEVQAWWDKGPKVLVCPSAYRPEVKGDDAGRTCGASMLSPRDVDLCGCGPGLMYCTYGRKHHDRVQDKIWNEVRMTAGYVVDNNLPIEELFTMNRTVRNNTAEAIYRRARVAAGESADKLFPVKGYGEHLGKLKPRHEMVPGQHAGVLTTPAMMYASDALRGVLRNFYDYLWCAGVSSSRVSTQSVLDLDVVDLRVGDGWKQLAGMPICTDCHARLDYGMQFFWGYPSSTMGIDFRPSLARKGKGKLYNANIEDVRGEADLTPAGFAKLAVAQPEFGECMSRKVTDHVFGGHDTPEDFDAVSQTFERTHRIKEMLRTAMKRYAERALSTDAKTTPPPTAPVNGDVADRVAGAGIATPGDRVPISRELRRMLDNECMQCHDEGDAFDFNGDALPKLTLMRMIDKVGFFAMPMGVEKLGEETRRTFVAEVARHLYPDAEDRAVATSFFAGGMRPHSAHRIRAVGENVETAAGHDVQVRLPSSIETAVAQSLVSYTPGVGLVTAVAAVRACREAKLSGEEFKSCVERASAPSNAVSAPISPPPPAPAYPHSPPPAPRPSPP